MATVSASSGKFRFAQDFKLNTLDIVVAVLLGIIQAVIEIVGALGFLERTVWLGGSAGFAFYAIYNGLTWLLYFAGAYLRKRAGVIVLAAVVTGLIRWFFGDPDGPILLWYALFPSIGALAVFWLLRWRSQNLLFALTSGAASGLNQVALFVVLGGFKLAGGAMWGLISILVGFLGGLVWGIAARYLGKGLQKAGAPTVQEPPARQGSADSYA
ncbi:MAG: hypothetical protein GEV07_25700 [Streptosporangiales bacterium]|nr:hypothetical protein [Streptosporangiales bacterium]